MGPQWSDTGQQHHTSPQQEPRPAVRHRGPASRNRDGVLSSMLDVYVYSVFYRPQSILTGHNINLA